MRSSYANLDSMAGGRLDLVLLVPDRLSGFYVAFLATSEEKSRIVGREKKRAPISAGQW